RKSAAARSPPEGPYANECRSFTNECRSFTSECRSFTSERRSFISERRSFTSERRSAANECRVEDGTSFSGGTKISAQALQRSHRTKGEYSERDVSRGPAHSRQRGLAGSALSGIPKLPA